MRHQTDPAETREPQFRAAHEDDGLHLSGRFDLHAIAALSQEQVSDLQSAKHINLAGLSGFDTAGAWFLKNCADKGAELASMPESHRALYDSVAESMPVPDPEQPPMAGWRQSLESLGRRTMGAVQFGRELAEYLGRFLLGLAHCIRHPRDFRLTSLVFHCQESGLKAVPIVSLMAFLIGVVLAFQGAAQLRQFGAEVFVVDLIAISVLRELGILLTAIIVAGRTASALTASIGSMKMREEIDAMRTLGINPDLALLVPRVLALVITLPLLGLVANLAGLLGGALMAWIELGVSPSMFRVRLIDGTSVNHVIVGLSKAPVFALIIGIIGVHAGMKVGSDAESLGRMTSTAVVNAIFAVIVADALFSIFFAQVGI